MKQKSVELIAFNKNQNFQYKGGCKVIVNQILSMLLIQPKNEEYKLMEAPYKWGFAMDKNIMFVFAEHDSSDFALIFRHENQCRKVYDFICNKKDQNFVVTKEMFHSRFWYPLCARLFINDVTSLKLKQIIMQWIDKNKNEEKEKYFQFLKQNNIYDFIYSSNNGIIVSLDDGDRERQRTHNRRNRKHSEITNIQSTNSDSAIQIQQSNHKNCTKVLTSQFKIANIKIGFQKYRKLLIFVNKNKCFEFSWGNKRKLYFCNKCNAITAIIDKNENGDECIKMEDKEHPCSPITYNPKKYIELLKNQIMKY